MIRRAFAISLSLLATACSREPRADTIPAAVLDQVLALHNQGVALMDRYQPEQAVAVFDEIVKLAPGWKTGRLNLGIALLNAQDPQSLERAETVLREVVRSDPDNPAGPFALGLMCLHLGRGDEARALMERVLALDSNDPHAHYQLAIAIAPQDPRAAVAHLERTLEALPHHESACYRLQALLRQLGETARADEWLARFQALKAAGAGVAFGFRYGEMGRYAEVVRTPDAARPGAGEALPAFADAAAAAGLTSGNDAGAQDLGPGLAIGDVDGDGALDVIVAASNDGVALWRNANGRFEPQPDSGIDLRGAIGAFLGDHDRDGDPDLFLTCAGPNRLYRNDGGRFVDVTAATATAGADARSTGAVWVDADHDGDLDLYVANHGAPNQLLRNDGDGSFTDVARDAGIDGGNAPTLGVLAFDVDGDRDDDLYLINDGAPNALFLNDRIGRYTDGTARFQMLRDDGPGSGALLGDVDNDGRADVLLLRGAHPPRLVRQLATGVYTDDTEFAALVAPLGGARSGALGDLDLDGDLDLVLLGAQPSVLRNDGGRFAAPSPLGAAGEPSARGAIAADLDGDGMLEVLVARAGAPPQLWRAPRREGRHWLTVLPALKDTPGTDPTAAGLHVEVKTGALVQVRELVTSSGYLSSPPLRAHFGLGARAQADYVRLLWSDAVLQSEPEISSDRDWLLHKVVRRPSSCPVLFSWDGQRFAFVTDLLGVGGVGFFAPPDGYAPPDPTESVRIAPELVQPRDGRYLLRLAEPLEEVTWLDHVALRVFDHPSHIEIHPDERFATQAPFPTGAPLAVAEKILPRAARTDRAESVLDVLAHIDRDCVAPPNDPRFLGYAHDHWLELDFGDRLASIPEDARLILYLHGWVEYTFSHVNYAAWQAGLAMRPPAIEVPDGDGGWRTAIASAGFPAGLPRTMTIDVSALPLRADGQLRIRTNMETFWDHAFLAVDVAVPGLRTHTLAPAVAELRWLGYPLEYSPDGRAPTIYDYERLASGIAFKNQRGDYTRYGDVREMLAEVDDEFVVMAKGDELALEFDAAALPPLPAGWTRTLVLDCDGYCKDMDLYTAFPDTVEPTPFHAMTNYPPDTAPPDEARLRASRARWNTRRVGR
jgi:tetratricopeptide (TPR) repeat protein